jgi:Mg/Co/Ni transporter MgtE
MEPDAAADLLGDLSDERTSEILVQMQPEERQEVTEMLEFKENTVVKIVLAPASTPLLALAQEPLISCYENAKEKEFAELFDKYNLLTLPVIDEHSQLTGVITPDDVIAMLRSKL